MAQIQFGQQGWVNVEFRDMTACSKPETIIAINVEVSAQGPVEGLNGSRLDFEAMIRTQHQLNQRIGVARLVDPIFIPGPGGQQNGYLEWQATVPALAIVEQAREGRDVHLALQLRHIVVTGNATPVSTSNLEGYLKIARSTWLDILKELGVSHVELIEVGSGLTNEQFDGNAGLLRLAEMQWAQGEFAPCIQTCNRVFERMVGKPGAREAWKPVFELTGISEDKKGRLVTLFHAFSNWQQIGRHELKDGSARPPADVGREDAVLALTMTRALVIYREAMTARLGTASEPDPEGEPDY